jgi:hypothetical protein
MLEKRLLKEGKNKFKWVMLTFGGAIHPLICKLDNVSKEARELFPADAPTRLSLADLQGVLKTTFLTDDEGKRQREAAEERQARQVEAAKKKVSASVQPPEAVKEALMPFAKRRKYVKKRDGTYQVVPSDDDVAREQLKERLKIDEASDDESEDAAAADKGPGDSEASKKKSRWSSSDDVNLAMAMLTVGPKKQGGFLWEEVAKSLNRSNTTPKSCQHRWGSLLKLQKEGKLSEDMRKMVNKVLDKVSKIKADRKVSKDKDKKAKAAKRDQEARKVMRLYDGEATGASDEDQEEEAQEEDPNDSDAEEDDAADQEEGGGQPPGAEPSQLPDAQVQTLPSLPSEQASSVSRAGSVQERASQAGTPRSAPPAAEANNARGQKRKQKSVQRSRQSIADVLSSKLAGSAKEKAAAAKLKADALRYQSDTKLKAIQYQSDNQYKCLELNLKYQLELAKLQHGYSKMEGPAVSLSFPTGVPVASATPDFPPPFFASPSFPASSRTAGLCRSPVPVTRQSDNVAPVPPPAPPPASQASHYSMSDAIDPLLTQKDSQPLGS